MSIDNPITWNQYAPEYLRRLNRPDDLNMSIILPRLLEHFPNNLSGLTVLDVGCGPGSLTFRLAQRGAKIVGIDSTQYFIECADALYPDGNPRFVLGDARSMNLNTKFDIVASNMALQDIPNIDKVIAGIANHLIQGGLFIFSLLHPARDTWQDKTTEHVLINPMPQELRERTGLQAFPPRYLRTEHRYEELLRQNALLPDKKEVVFDHQNQPLSLIMRCQKI